MSVQAGDPIRNLGKNLMVKKIAYSLMGVTAIIVGISLYIVTKDGGEVPSPDPQDSQAN